MNLYDILYSSMFLYDNIMKPKVLYYGLIIGLILGLFIITGIVSASCSEGVCSGDSGSYVYTTPSSRWVSSDPCSVYCSSCASGYCDDCNGDGYCDSSESNSGNSGSCTVHCSTCATGYCDDCNHDGYCDSPEGYSSNSGSCTVHCSSCASGYCDDCNHDGYCDSPESNSGYNPGSSSSTFTGTSILIISTPQSPVYQPTPTPTKSKVKVITKTVTKLVKKGTDVAVVVKTAQPLDASTSDKSKSSGTAGTTAKTITTSAGQGSTGTGSTGSTALTGSATWTNENSNPVLNGPTKPTTITFSTCVKIVSIKTVHWNNGKGQTPGTIALKLPDGTQYGPWTARGEADRTGAPNVNWVAEPQITIKAGTYTVVDSDTKTWSYNSGSQNSGIAIVSYDKVACPAGMGTPIPTVRPAGVVAPTSGQSVLISSNIGSSFSSSGSSLSFGSGSTSFSSGGFSFG